ncbi:MAG: GNAT family N-acetyltransferase [Alphaproteobacteria bacterium]|nr:GNAT family N-acetyltransferase [Alphaproteobacteria bacterium]
MSLRPEQPEDRPFIDRLYASTRIEELETSGLPKPMWGEFLALQAHAQWTHYNKAYRPHSDFWVIEQGGQLVGRLYLFANAKDIRIIDIALLPEARSRGIGGALLTALQRCAAEEGKVLSIHVEATNRALTLYTRLGFQRVSDHPPYQLMHWHPPALATPATGA